MKKALDFLTAKPARFFLLAALIWTGIMIYLNTIDGNNFSWHDILISANGMVFDLIVFGVILSLYEELKSKKEKVDWLNGEIDDCRRWDEKQATIRIVGAVKRLNMLGVHNIDLSYCYLNEADLRKANLQGANLEKANLDAAVLRLANFQGANLHKANLIWAILTDANLKGADLEGAILKGAILTKADLEGADLEGADLEGADLERARVNEEWFEKLEEWEVIGREAIKAKYRIGEDTRLHLK